MKANEKANNVKVNESANVASNVAAAEPQQKAIEQKRADILKECFKSIELSKIASDTRAKFEGAGLGKFTAIYRPSDKKENGKYGKSGGKTIYNFETETTIYMGYTSSELSDVFGLEKRAYKSTESKNESEVLKALKQLKAALENVNKYGVFEPYKISDIEAAIEKQEFWENERAQFEKEFAAVIPLFDVLSESTFAKKYGEENLKIAKQIGYRFSDTKSDKESK